MQMVSIIDRGFYLIFKIVVIFVKVEVRCLIVNKMKNVPFHKPKLISEIGLGYAANET
jgi:hypothetical protein